jgi:hypothetical protein
MVPHAMVLMKRMLQTPVMIPPTGKMSRPVPGTTKGASDATTKVWMGGSTAALVMVEAWVAKAPATKEASLEVRVVFVIAPDEVVPVKVTTGRRRVSIVALHFD